MSFLPMTGVSIFHGQYLQRSKPTLPVSQNSFCPQRTTLMEKKLVQVSPFLSTLECVLTLLLEHIWILHSVKTRFSVWKHSFFTGSARGPSVLTSLDHIVGTGMVSREFPVLPSGPRGMTGKSYVLSKNVCNNRTHLSSCLWPSPKVWRWSEEAGEGKILMCTQRAALRNWRKYFP